ncbi:L-serine ammonia-lyase, iron-sulfur-dependent subunit beta [Thermoanaerobacterium sp. RBIITD]|uniref:L-serine ammonia-lyase, iron-sulfur-dependent subunit beta n=1 Tax=Thermoanaerobacterium sp. RBIITD TaxID=1550240 RepID=UPI000BC0700E|nr:L-serine ammonia-lyase, iron-sulfur-dependent subunit beta [Thermoanaerobacterium sp. RBIITD]SNX52701.1 L-serine dehydratase [Thermoanaerobacterium sp. RBIITD]
MREYSVFDIMGPIMIGPSSSHTAGAARLSKIARQVAGDDIKDVQFVLFESFAHTYKGHGTEKALVAGILGLDPDDDRLPRSFELAKEQNISFTFIESNEEAPHPNTVRIIIRGKTGNVTNILGSSIGGGNVVLKEINGMNVEFTGEYETLITKHVDKPGIIAKVTKVLSDYEINIAFMRVYRQLKGDNAIMVIESDQNIPDDARMVIEDIDGIEKAIIINSI